MKERYTVTTVHAGAANHAIADGGIIIIAHVVPTGYPLGEGWSPDSEAIAKRIAAALNFTARIAARTLYGEVLPEDERAWAEECRQLGEDGETFVPRDEDNAAMYEGAVAEARAIMTLTKEA
jgi:hypothetical protein